MRVHNPGTNRTYDEKHQIEALIVCGGHKGRPNDWCQGVIKVKGRVACQVTGSLCSAIFIDSGEGKKKYYDWRYLQPHRLILKRSGLPSDWAYREDLQTYNHALASRFFRDFSWFRANADGESVDGKGEARESLEAR